MRGSEKMTFRFNDDMEQLKLIKPT